MRVTLLHFGFPEYTMGLANALSTLAEVTVVHPHSASDVCGPLAAPGVCLVPFEKPKLRRDLRNLAAMRQAFQLIRASRPDVLHVQEMFDYSYDFCSLFSRLPRLVTTIHDVVPHPGDGHQAFGLSHTKAIGCWRSRRLIVHTEQMRSQLARRFRISPEKIRVVQHGELGSLYKNLAWEGGQPSLPRERLTILFFGRVWAYKGLRFLLDAFALMRATMPDVHLIIAGKGGDLDANEQYIHAIGGIEVRKDFIPAKEVAGLFERSSVLVLPYIEASQSGVAAIGFTTGTVVVASRVGGLADLIEHEHTGMLVPPRDPEALAAMLRRVLEDEHLQQRLRESGQALAVGELSWKTIAQKTVDVYREALL